MEQAIITPQSDAANLTKKRKRARAIQACERCRNKKYKCDELYPACTHCKKAEVDCIYGRTRPRDGEPDLNYVRSLEARVGDLDATLKEYAARHIKPDARQAYQPQRRSLGFAGQQLTPGAMSNVVSGDAETQHEGEITDVNQHTNGIEFHGSTSSMAFLDRLRKFSRRTPSDSNPTPEQNNSLVSALHNSAFSQKVLTPKDAASSTSNLTEERFYFAQAHVFIDSYFSGIHYVHPIIDKASFMARANELWLGNTSPTNSFLALYLSVMSLGALMMTWQEEVLDGYTRFQWSRRLFSEALSYINQLQFSNDLDTVHSLYLMAKICQNELNPHVAWVYLGRAIRTCISAGFNRDTHAPKTYNSETLSRTWWGLFSLEIETSFSLGRADTLGLDEYHNRPLPQKQYNEFAIIPCMVDLAHIIRKVSLYYNAKPAGQSDDLTYIFMLEANLDAWLDSIPSQIQPGTVGTRPLSALREPGWCRRQRLVLEIRYHMVRMALFRHFMELHNQEGGLGDQQTAEALFRCSNKCTSSAKHIIEVIYEAYKVEVYFRTWWYNTTYIMMAAAALLSYIKRSQSGSDISLIRRVNMAIEILEAMDDSVVARQCAEILRRHLHETTETGSAIAASNVGTVPPQGNQGFPEGYPLAEDQFVDYQILDFSFSDMASLFQEFNDLN